MTVPTEPERCEHGCSKATVCPHCDPDGFLFAYAKTINIIERKGYSDQELSDMVAGVRSDSIGPE